MGRTRRWVALSIAIAIVVASPAVAGAALSNQERAELAIGFLRAHQEGDGSIPAFSPIGSTADAVLAVVSAGVGPGLMRHAIGYLAAQTEADQVTAIGLRAKVAMAVAAAGGDPRRFAGHNLVREIRDAGGGDGHFAEASVLDQALALIALRGAAAVLPAGSKQWLRAAQCPDGGWAFDAPYDPDIDDEHCSSDPESDFFPSDSNTSAYAVMALAPSDLHWLADPIAFFDSVRDPGAGGWSYSGAFVATDANSTALVLQAYAAMGLEAPAGGRAALRSLQYVRCGAFAFTSSGEEKSGPDVGATIGAVPGLLGVAFPVTGSVERPAPRTPDCAG